MESTSSTSPDFPSAFLGFGLLLISLVCLGTWPALLRLCSISPPSPSTRFLGCPVIHRDTRFAYMDYALSYVISSSIPLAVSLSSGNDASFQEKDSNNQNTVLILFSLIGGSLLSLGNMSMQWATTVFGAPLTTVVAIQASLTVVLGTFINYVLEPQRTARPEFLFAGILVFLGAIGLASRAHLLYGEERDEGRRILYAGVDGIELGPNPERSYGSLESEESSLESKASQPASAFGGGSGLFFENTRQLDNTTYSTSGEKARSSKQALAIAFFGGCCFGFFSPAFNIAVNDPFEWSGDGESTLSVPVANLWFSFAFAVASFLGSIPLIHNPPEQFALGRTTFQNYCQEPLFHRLLAMLAGCVCGAGNLLQFQGGRLVGFAAADLVQAFPIVSTFWDMSLFGEFKGAGKTVLLYMLAMYTMYGGGIIFLMLSAAK